MLVYAARQRGGVEGGGMEIGTGSGRPVAGPSWPEPGAVRGVSRLQPLRQFFAAGPIACPYLPGQAERKLIVELNGAAAAEFYDELSRAGFRRSQTFAYRPACPECTACVPVRIAVNAFAHSRSTRRVRNANRGLAGRLVTARATPEQYRLFAGYQRSRHRDSDMAAMSYADYRSMVEDTPLRTVIAEFRGPDGGLVAASLLDRLDDGVSAVYSFYDPGCERRSLGTWSILWLVEECRRQGLPYVYLGYWIGASPKMAYKARFPAVERLTATGWTPVK
ncbi:MAG TPA: arginyltransferase [Stellaceae bacterium]|nr:arginyltransferase [Stellaceae bacterium]